MKTVIDMENYPRKAHFDYFRSLAYPYAGITANVDVTGLYASAKKRGVSFFLASLYCAANAVNSVPELRMRIEDGGISLFDRCPTSHVELLENGTFCYCRLENDMPFDDFIEYAKRERTRSRLEPTIEDGEDSLSFVFVTCVPWVHFTSLIEPVPCGDESNPRIAFGKFSPEGGRLMMPVSIIAHHSLADGMHLASFYRGMEEQIARLSE